MKKVISWLICKAGNPVEPHQWWSMEETKHSDPPEERVGLYTWPQIVTMLRNKLGRFKE